MWLKDLLKKRRAQARAVTAPEDYWHNLGENVVGNISKDEMLVSRQIDTYKVICRIIAGLPVHYVADLGCNVSIMGVLLRESGYTGEYIGIDANPHALTIAEKNLSRYENPYKLFKGNLRKLNFPSNSFECTILKDVLEHMEDFRPVLGEALRVASMYAVVANFIPWTEGETIIRKEPTGYFHNLYARKEVYAFIREHGYDVVSVTSSLEKDARPNEIVLLRRADDLGLG